MIIHALHPSIPRYTTNSSCHRATPVSNPNPNPTLHPSPPIPLSRFSIFYRMTDYTPQKIIECMGKAQARRAGGNPEGAQGASAGRPKRRPTLRPILRTCANDWAGKKRGPTHRIALPYVQLNKTIMVLFSPHPGTYSSQQVHGFDVPHQTIARCLPREINATEPLFLDSTCCTSAKPAPRARKNSTTHPTAGSLSTGSKTQNRPRLPQSL